MSPSPAAPLAAVADAPLQPFTPEFAPGLFTEATDRGAKARYKDGNRVRFVNGYPQVLGGWTKQAMTGGPIKGIARRVHEWRSIDRQNFIAIGTSAKLYLLNENTLYDITPMRRQVSRTDPFTTTNGSPVVTVTDANHDAIQNDFVRFSGASAVGGLTLNGEFQVVSILGVGSYTINAGANANAGATGGGVVTMEYDINNGGEDTGFFFGWGTCTWGSSTWGTARGGCSTMPRNLRVWSLDNWGEDLIASPSEGAVYYWDRTLGTQSRAVLINGAPVTNQRILVSPENRQLVCLGAHDDTQPDPLRIRVSDNENFTQFTSGVGNTYRKRIDSGSKIITGFRTRSGILIHTDLAIHIMQATADSQVFSVRQLSEGNSIISPNGGIEVNGIGYWMSDSKFMMFDGVVQEIPCEVRSRVFGTQQDPGINFTQRDKIYCWHNDAFSEIWWFYPSAGSAENDRYVILNIEKLSAITWTFGSLVRTAASRKSTFYNKPFTFDSAGNLYLHENGIEDHNGTVSIPMQSFLESYDVEIGDGNEQMFIGRAVADFKYLTGQVALFLKTKRYPESDTYTTKGPYLFAPSRTFRGTRAKGRQVAVRYESGTAAAGGASAHWRMGNWTYKIKPDGDR